MVTAVVVTCCWLWLGVSLRPVAEGEVRLGTEPHNQYNHTDPGEVIMVTGAANKPSRRFTISSSTRTNPPVSYDLCVSLPISCQLTLGSLMFA